ncbi:MAG: 3-hydroxybutyryl-CoA dehydrogenase [Myxococcales bacterium]|nr:3-hydroxybutyryl-CoA dehydrogenase [Myxococcales bacterium]
MTDIRTLAVIGAGQMGRGIAQVAAQSGLEVMLLDIDLAHANQGRDRLGKDLGRLVDKGKMPSATRDEILAKITPQPDMAGLKRADFVIEAATEERRLKERILRDADASMKADAVLASNTSSLSLTQLASCTKRPHAVIGMHFMNPVPLMELVEIIRALQTSDATYVVTKSLAERWGKTVISAKDSPGFVVNRMLIPFLNEACFVLQEGLATPEDIDKGARLGLHHPMGPLELADLVGLDTCLYITEILHRELGDDKYRPATLLRNYVAAGWHGRKTGRGFYTY